MAVQTTRDTTSGYRAGSMQARYRYVSETRSYAGPTLTPVSQSDKAVVVGALLFSVDHFVIGKVSKSTRDRNSSTKTRLRIAKPTPASPININSFVSTGSFPTSSKVSTQIPQKSAWARGPPRTSTSASPTRFQSSVLPPQQNETDPPARTRSRRLSALGQKGVAIRDGINIPSRGNVGTSKQSMSRFIQD